MDTNSKIVMYIFVNSSLKMTKGKACSQVAHVTQLIVEDIVRKGYETNPPPRLYFTYMKWRSNCTKIILKATEDQLRGLMKLEGAMCIVDDGQTQVKPGSLTAVGFPPSSEMGDLAKDFKLLE
jgi:peptidyl-tRNA hydrolase